MAFFVPQMFTAVAFDSGGVASGPMTATFVLPFGVGACAALGGDIMTDAFGLVALVALAPLFTLQLAGLRSQLGQRSRRRRPAGAGSGCAKGAAGDAGVCGDPEELVLEGLSGGILYLD